MKDVFGIFGSPSPPINESRPVVIVWRESGVRHEKHMKDLKAGRAAAISVIGMDDRIVVGIFDRKTKEIVGKVGVVAGCPYWKCRGHIRTLNPDGTLVRDMYDF